MGWTCMRTLRSSTFFSKIDVQSFGSFVKVYEVINLESHLHNYIATIIIYKKTFQGNKQLCRNDNGLKRTGTRGLFQSTKHTSHITSLHKYSELVALTLFTCYSFGSALRPVVSRCHCVAPLLGLRLLLGYHYDYAIHGSLYTSAHVLI